MRRGKLVLAVILVAGVAAVVAAGEKMHAKCDGDPADCLAKMHAKLAAKPWLGVEMDGTDDGHYRITEVVAGGPAEKAGFEEGDILQAMNGVEYLAKDKEAMKKAWDGVKPGSRADYVLLRKGAKVKVAVELGNVPHDLMAQWIGEHMLKAHLEAPEKVAEK